MTEIHEYATTPFGEVHLVTQAEAARTDRLPITRCGYDVWLNRGWQLGDETLAGIAATCARCRQVAGLQP